MTQSNKQKAQQQGNQRQSDPWSNAAKGSEASFLERMTDGLIGAHSPRGLMALGWTNLLASQMLNAGFWMSVCGGVGAVTGITQTLQGDFQYVVGLIVGFTISIGSSFFQGYPIVQSRAASNILSEMLAGLFRPQVNNLPRNVDSDRVAQYQGVSSAFNSTMKKLGNFATAIEVAAGIIFMGSIFGGGWASLMALMIFAYSIAGTQLGLIMIVHARNVALPAAGRDAVRKLAGKAKANVFQALK